MQRLARAARTRALLCLFAAACALSSQAAAQTAGRERALFTRGWRFQKDDPQGAEGRLAYEKIKDWVKATGDELVRAKATKPEGEPGMDVSYTRRDFDDRGWRSLDLPHDWGVEGPFRQEYPGETGKLPWWGVGWYRKHFNVPAADRGRRIFLG
jgi:beta-galactosidase